MLTFHRCINYGSYWQARCLVEGLRARGLDAVLLDHHSAAVDRAEWRCALQPLLPAPSPAADRASYAAKVRRFGQAFAALPRSRPFRLDAPSQMERFDVVVVGSDEVWNLRHPWYGGYPAFFGEGLNASRIVSYAASCGSHDAAEGLPPRWAERLRAFDTISVRDPNSAQLVARATGRAPALVLDPCLQFAPVCDGPERDERYAVVYGHSFPASFRDAVRGWAKRRGLRLVSLGYRNAWADEQRLTAGPEAFARAMAGAAAVVTNFFHGCVFALVNRKPFACANSPYRANKVRALTAAVGAERRLVGEDASAAECAELLDTPLESAVSRRIDEARRRSEAYLDAALA